MLPTLHPRDTVWILDRRTMGRVVKEIAPRSFVVETQEGNVRQNRRALVLMPKDVYRLWGYVMSCVIQGIVRA